MNTLPRPRTHCSIYQYDKVVLQLECCQSKLSRQKREIIALHQANARLKLLISEEMPLAIKPVKFLKHAARHLRVSNKRSPAIHLLFKLAASIEYEQSKPFRPAKLAPIEEGTK